MASGIFFKTYLWEGTYLKMKMGRKIISPLLLILLVLFSCNTRSKKEAMQYYTKGRELGMKLKYEEALDMFNLAIKVYPDLPEAHNGAGFAYYKLKEYDKAEEEFFKAIKLKRDYIKPYNNLGNLYFETGKLPKAIEVWEKYLVIDPNNAELLAKVGNAKMNEGGGEYYNVVEALGHLQKAVALAPSVPAYRLLLADCYMKFKDYLPNSITEYNTLLNTPDVPPEITLKAYSGLAYAYFASGKNDEAIITIKNGLRLFPEDFLMNLYAGQIFAETGKNEEAEKRFEKAMQIDPQDIRIYIQFPAFYMNAGKYDKVEAIYKKGMENLPNAPILPLNFGLFYTQRLGDCDRAIEMFKKSIELNIKIAFIPYGEIGKCLIKQKKYDEALDVLEKALKLALDADAKYALECRYYLAEVYRQTGRPEKMKEHLDKVIEISPESIWAEKGKEILQSMEE